MPLATLLRKPATVRRSTQFRGWFAKIADELLNRSELHVADQPHRLIEIEFYYFGDGHLDPFSHRQPITQTPGIWYLHRTGSSLRGGTFKGADITFGHKGAFGGILIRALQTQAATIIEGPSLCVDYFLKLTGLHTVVELDKALARRKVWDPHNLMRIVSAPTADDRQIYCSARVGLTLKNPNQSRARHGFISRSYRFLTEPRRLKKGRRQLVLGLHSDGVAANHITQLTGCPAASVARHLLAHRAE